MDCSMPGFPVHNQLPGLTQTHIHRVSDAIQPSHPLWSPSPPAFNLSQHQGHFKWVSSLYKFQFSHSGSPTLWDPMECSMPGFPVHHQFLELTQTYVHWVSDPIQWSHPLLSPSPPAVNLSGHQGLFQWVRSTHKVVKVLWHQLQHSNEYSGLISFRMDWFELLAV